MLPRFAAICLGVGLAIPAAAQKAPPPRAGETGKPSERAAAKKSDEELLRWLRYITLLETKAAEEPDDYNLLLRLADAYGRLGEAQREKVVYYTTQATLVGADDARADVVLGDFYTRIGEKTAAIRAFLRVLDIAPEHTYSMVKLRALLVSADPKSVDIDLPTIKKILGDAGLYVPITMPKKADPDSARTISEQGYGFLTAKDYDAALDRFRAALDADPNSAVAVRGMGIVFAEQKQIRQALAAYSAYLDLAPDAEDAPAVREVLEIFYEQR